MILNQDEMSILPNRLFGQEIYSLKRCDQCDLWFEEEKKVDYFR